MRIVFLCSSLEPGRDGVGDYSRRLAEELVKQGHECVLVALNDRYTERGARARANELDTVVSERVLRLTCQQGWHQRIELLRKTINEFNPDFISFQFVPWGLHEKGLPYKLGSKFRVAFESVPVHVMCHELWLDKIFPLPLRQRLLGVAQKIVLKKFFRELRPKLVTTHLEYYRDLLARIGIESGLLPLHGNIPVSGTREQARGWLADQTGVNREAFVAGFFGNLWQTFDIRMLQELVDEFEVRGRSLCIMGAGSLAPSGERNWEAVETELGERCRVYKLGVLAAEKVSLYLASLDLGLTTYPGLVAGKSGAVAAMLEHGVPVRTLGRLRHRPENSEFIAPGQGATVAETAGKLMAALESASLR